MVIGKTKVLNPKFCWQILTRLIVYPLFIVVSLIWTTVEIILNVDFNKIPDSSLGVKQVFQILGVGVSIIGCIFCMIKPTLNGLKSLFEDEPEDESFRVNIHYLIRAAIFYPLYVFSMLMLTKNFYVGINLGLCGLITLNFIPDLLKLYFARNSAVDNNLKGFCYMLEIILLLVISTRLRALHSLILVLMKLASMICLRAFESFIATPEAQALSKKVHIYLTLSIININLMFLFFVVYRNHFTENNLIQKDLVLHLFEGFKFIFKPNLGKIANSLL